MKRRAVLIAGLALALPAQSGHAETLTCAQILHFGTFVSCGAGQSATLAPAGAISATGCLTPMGGHMPGHCRLSDITDTSVITISADGPLGGDQGGSMTIDQFLLQPLGGGPVAPALPVTSDLIGGVLDFAVGATLHIGGMQTGGVYNGTYTLTVNFP